MKIINVKFEKPYRHVEGDEVVWQFQAETDEKLPHGYPCYAGELRKTAEGWQARPYASKGGWSAAGRSRMDAMVNNLPYQIEYFQAGQDAERAREVKESMRQTVSDLMNDGLPEGLSVHATNVQKLDAPLNFTITVENLKEADARKLVARIHQLIAAGFCWS